MVQFPIRLHGAATDRNIRFNQVHKECKQRTNSSTVCRHCARDVERSELVKGYEVTKGQMVLLEENDFANLPLNSVKSVEVIATVDPDDIPVSMVVKTYWVGPDDRVKVGHKAFVLFREALDRSGMVAIGRIAMTAGRETLVAIRPWGKALALTTLHWSDELVASATVEETVSDVEISEAEADLADKLVGSLLNAVDVMEQKDAYREALESVIDAKLSGTEPVKMPERQETESVDLMAALTASVDAATKAA